MNESSNQGLLWNINSWNIINNNEKIKFFVYKQYRTSMNETWWFRKNLW